MGLTAFNRYVRICKSDQQYRKFFTLRKSRAWLACVWILVALYSALPKLACLQDYMFVPGYALCSTAHLSEGGEMTHYTIVLCLFLLTPLATTIFSYVKVAKTIQTAQCRCIVYDPQKWSKQTHDLHARDQAQQISLRCRFRIYDMLDPILGNRYFKALSSSRNDATKFGATLHVFLLLVQHNKSVYLRRDESRV